MSLYYVQKFLYQLNRDPVVQANYRRDPDAVLGHYELTGEEIEALKAPDIGLLFVMGVNGQILMHFAAFHQIAWADYLQRMRGGIAEHGPVRDGVYAMTGFGGVEAHSARMARQTPVADAEGCGASSAAGAEGCGASSAGGAA